MQQLMTYAGTSEVYNMLTDTQFQYQLTPSNEAYIQIEQSDDGGTTWTARPFEVIKSAAAAIEGAQPANRLYRVKLYGGIGTLDVILDSQP